MIFPFVVHLSFYFYLNASTHSRWINWYYRELQLFCLSHDITFKWSGVVIICWTKLARVFFFLRWRKNNIGLVHVLHNGESNGWDELCISLLLSKALPVGLTPTISTSNKSLQMKHSLSFIYLCSNTDWIVNANTISIVHCHENVSMCCRQCELLLHLGSRCFNTCSDTEMNEEPVFVYYWSFRQCCRREQSLLLQCTSVYTAGCPSPPVHQKLFHGCLPQWVT